MKTLLAAILLSSCTVGSVADRTTNAEAYDTFLTALCTSAVACGYYEDALACEGANTVARDELNENAWVDDELFDICLDKLATEFYCTVYSYPVECFQAMNLYKWTGE
jgi:hypothetical protein